MRPRDGHPALPSARRDVNAGVLRDLVVVIGVALVLVQVAHCAGC